MINSKSLNLNNLAAKVVEVDEELFLPDAFTPKYSGRSYKSIQDVKQIKNSKNNDGDLNKLTKFERQINEY